MLRWTGGCAPLLIASIAAQCAIGEDVDLAKRVKMDTADLPKQGMVSLSHASIVEKCLPSVVTVLTVKYVDPGKGDLAEDGSNFDLPKDTKSPRELHPMRGSGSGVILTPDGYILTNNHVVENADTIHVRIPEAERDLVAKLIGRDPLTDVALLKAEATGLQPITVADSMALRRGDVVLALGSPFGLEQTVTMGIVSATGRTLGFIRNGYEDFIQTDAAINPGNSGGAVVDGLGRLVGINTLTYAGGWMPAQGIGFAVPSSLALRVAGDLLRHGHVVRGYMGVQWTEASEEDAIKLTGRIDVRPARVVSIEAGTPAEKAGFEGGDIILALNGHPVPSLAKARYAVATMLPGTKARFTVLRGGEKHAVDVTLIEMPGTVAVVSKPSEKGGTVLQDALEVSELTIAARVEFRIPADTKGVLVTRAEENGKPITRLAPGDVISSVNGKDVNEPAAVVDLFRQAADGKPLMLRVWKKGEEKFVLLHKK